MQTNHEKEYSFRLFGSFHVLAVFGVSICDRRSRTRDPEDKDDVDPPQPVIRSETTGELNGYAIYFFGLVRVPPSALFLSSSKTENIQNQNESGERDK